MRKKKLSSQDDKFILQMSDHLMKDVYLIPELPRSIYFLTRVIIASLNLQST